MRAAAAAVTKWARDVAAVAVHAAEKTVIRRHFKKAYRGAKAHFNREQLMQILLQLFRINTAPQY